jgi:hypothetical protein
MTVCFNSDCLGTNAPDERFPFMSDHPAVSNTSHAPRGIDWNDHATLNRKGDGEGVLYAMKAIRSGTVQELVRFVMSLPEGERTHYVIEKAGDRRLEAGEIAALAARSDCPR